jgi:uncharacterized protein (TIGR04255 family)
MPRRPADLPDYTSPPVTEVSLGVQFNNLEKLLTPHLGLIWSAFKKRYPVAEEMAPVPSAFETFPERGSGIPHVQLQLQMMGAPILPRVLLLNEEKTELLQFQRDHFYHNWRGEGGAYPHFEAMLETFEQGLERLNKLLEEQGLGAIVPNQAEVLYVNHVPVPSGSSIYDVFAQVFEPWFAPDPLDELGEPEDARFLLRYIIRNENVPIGRLMVTAEPAWRADGAFVLQFQLHARGRPRSADFQGIAEFLKLGRIHIVKAFDRLTSPAMHEKWGKHE